jgi:hypothetical protein
MKWYENVRSFVLILASALRTETTNTAKAKRSEHTRNHKSRRGGERTRTAWKPSEFGQILFEEVFEFLLFAV